MIAAHFAAVKAVLVAAPNLTPYDGGTVPDLTEPPYMVWWLNVDRESSIALCDEQGRADWRLTTHSVGDNAEAAGIVADRVHDALHRVRLTVSGRDCWKIRHEFGLPPQDDDSTGRTVVDVVDTWTFSSTPA